MLLAVLALSAFVFVQSLKPDYEGEVSLPGLSQGVDVYFDPYGIPHIYADTEADAFRALGYVHAQDRLWQMELLRRLAIGGLSEVFGEVTIPTDRFFLALGIDDATSGVLKELDKNATAVLLSEAYLSGINQFIAEGPTPIEFVLTGIDKKPYELRDIQNILGYMAFSFAQAHKTDPLLTDILTELGPEYLLDLAPHVDPNTTLIKNYPDTTRSGRIPGITAIEAALKNLPVPLLEGSNSWVIAPSRTAGKQVIFANDPHIGFAQPSVWYEAHLVTPGYEKYGYHLGGIPFPILGHDRNIAYGMTMFENDDLDFYRETLHPEDSSLYKTPDGWMKFNTVRKVIKVKDGEDVEVSLRSTIHGPLLNDIADQIPGSDPVSMAWIFTQEENRVIEALYEISHAGNIGEFRQALPKIHAPGLNIMYGDAEGNVAWWATAKLYELPEGADSKLFLDGSTGTQEINRFLDFSDNPQAINPPWGYVYSANNQPDSIGGRLYPGYYLPENRAKRIVALLEQEEDWDREKVEAMITDVTSAVNPSIAVNLIKSMRPTTFSEFEQEVIDKLELWDGTYTLGHTEGAVYHRWIYFLLKGIYADEMGEERFKQYLSTHLMKRVIAGMAVDSTSVWWDNIKTDEVEGHKAIIKESFQQAITSLKNDIGDDHDQWNWSKLHTIEHGHPIGQQAQLRSFFNVGPFPVHGTREVINNLGFLYDDDAMFHVTSGPSTRRVIDFSDIGNSTSILPTGQSGNPWSDHYDDQAEMFVNGEFRKMMMNKTEIESSSKNLLRFVPANQ